MPVPTKALMLFDKSIFCIDAAFTWSPRMWSFSPINYYVMSLFLIYVLLKFKNKKIDSAVAEKMYSNMRAEKKYRGILVVSLSTIIWYTTKILLSNKQSESETINWKKKSTHALFPMTALHSNSFISSDTHSFVSLCLKPFWYVKQ